MNCADVSVQIKEELEKKAEKRTRYLSWIGLALMGTQFGFMARLTWWEYSWDVMEPVTYFVGYATAIAMFAYYVITRKVSIVCVMLYMVYYRRVFSLLMIKHWFNCLLSKTTRVRHQQKGKQELSSS